MIPPTAEVLLDWTCELLPPTEAAALRLGEGAVVTVEARGNLDEVGGDLDATLCVHVLGTTARLRVLYLWRTLISDCAALGWELRWRPQQPL